MEWNENSYPPVCRGCAEDCRICEKRIRGIAVSTLRQMATRRKIKEQAILRLYRELEQIDVYMNTLLADERT